MLRLDRRSILKPCSLKFKRPVWLIRPFADVAGSGLLEMHKLSEVIQVDWNNLLVWRGGVESPWRSSLEPVLEPVLKPIL